MREYLRNLREAKGYTMQEVADKLNISKQYYQQIEQGERQKKMDITLVQGISSVFGISLERVVNAENMVRFFDDET